MSYFSSKVDSNSYLNPRMRGPIKNLTFSFSSLDLFWEGTHTNYPITDTQNNISEY